MLGTCEKSVPSFREPIISKSLVRIYLRRLLIKHPVVIVKLCSITNIRFDYVCSVTLLRSVNFLFLLQKLLETAIDLTYLILYSWWLLEEIAHVVLPSFLLWELVVDHLSRWVDRLGDVASTEASNKELVQIAIVRILSEREWPAVLQVVYELVGMLTDQLFDCRVDFHLPYGFVLLILGSTWKTLPW